MIRLLVTLRLALWRTAGLPGPAAIRLVGMLVAVTLVVGVSTFSTAMGDAMLQARLHDDPTSVNVAFSTTNQAVLGSTYSALDGYVRSRTSRDLGLPLYGLIVEHTTSTARLYRFNLLTRRLEGSSIGDVALHYQEGLANHAKIVTGQLDNHDGLHNGSAGVLLARDTAARLHLHVGDHVAFSADGIAVIGPSLVVNGLYVQSDPGSAYWAVAGTGSSTPSLTTAHLAVFQAFAAHPDVFSPIYFWFQQTDVPAIHFADANAILSRLARMRSTTSALVSSTLVLTSLDADISGFMDQYDLLPFILLILAGPIVALVLYANLVVTSLVLEQQAGEIALLRSRGAAQGRIFVVYMVEGLLFGAMSILLGPILGLPLAGLIGRASGFVAFGGGLSLDLRLTPQVYVLAGGTALLSVLAGLLPALRLARRPLLALKADQGRAMQGTRSRILIPDLALLAMALYGLAVLNRQGAVTSGAATAAVAQDPLIALAPLAFAVALALLLSHVLPTFAAMILKACAAVSSPSVHVALLSVARSPRQPIRLVQLCTMTLALGIFAATVAGIDASNRTDQESYAAGATLRLEEFTDHSHDTGPGKPDSMPLADHLKLPGVRAVMPAMRYQSTGNVVNAASGGAAVNVLGIDPGRAEGVIWFRSDFADQSLRSLLNLIASPGPNAIVSETFLQATGLHQGDTFQVTLTNTQTISARIVAVVRYFPSLDPRAYPFAVTNLAYLNAVSHGHGPNEMWLAANGQPRTLNRLVSIARRWPRQIVDYEGIPAGDNGADPLRVGIYGVVSVGFLISVGLALLGFLAYMYLSLQQRLAEFAIVRALGLSPSGMRSLLLYEHLFLLTGAMLGGIAAGVLTTQLFLPYLPIATNTVPPFLVVTPWRAVAAFVAAMSTVFVAVMSICVTLVLRLQLGNVLRLGER